MGNSVAVAATGRSGERASRADSALARARAAYLAALLERNSARARRVVDEAAEQGAPVLAIVEEVLRPALHEVGRLWETGEVNVAEEHYATAISRHVLALLIERLGPLAPIGRLVVVATTPGELHDLGAEVLAAHLRDAGWEPLLLGASVPPADLAALAEAEGADAVVLSTTLAAHRGAALEALGPLTAGERRPFVALGGQAWAGADTGPAQSAGADLVSDRPEELVAALKGRFPLLAER